MTALNRGVALLNDQPLEDDEPAVFCVLGTGGGGTTMTSRLLEAAGVFMGEGLAFSAEDLEFAAILRSERPDRSKFEGLIARRNAEHRRWGFKSPLRHHWSLLSGIANVRFVTIFRDIVAIGMRSEIDSPDRVLKSMTPIINLQKSILDSITSTSRPLLLISYEKALMAPEVVSTHLLGFSGIAESETSVGEDEVDNTAERTPLCRRAPTLASKTPAQAAAQEPATFSGGQRSRPGTARSPRIRSIFRDAAGRR